MRFSKYDINTIYFTIGRNAKRIYNLLPNGDSKIPKIEHYAEKIGISPSYLYHIFSGKQAGQEPSFMTIINLCNAFECKIEDLLVPLDEKEYVEFFNKKGNLK